MSSLLSIYLFSFMALYAQEVQPIVIMGGGVAALSAATYVARAGYEPILISGPLVGGAIAATSSIQNWPGELDISGPALIEKMQQQAIANKVSIHPDFVTKVDFSTYPFEITTSRFMQGDFKVLKAYACILALGSKPNLLQVPGEIEYFSKGVSTCATCDGALYRNKTVAVVGGGDSAVSEALYLSKLAKKVFVFVRKESFIVSDEKSKKALTLRSNVEIHYRTEVTSIYGNGKHMTHVKLNSFGKDVLTLNLDGLFLATGSIPNTDLFANQLELDNQGYIVLKEGQQTSISGVFAAGDISDPHFRQAITAAGDGAKAALQATNYLSSSKQFNNSSKLEVKRLEQPSIQEIDSFYELHYSLKNTSLISFVLFSTKNCAPCRTFKLYYEQWNRQFGDRLQLLTVSLDRDATLASAYGITGVPTLLIFDRDKKPIYYLSGLEPLAKLHKRLEAIQDKSFIVLEDLELDL